jgi:hypothetical protein
MVSFNDKHIFNRHSPFKSVQKAAPVIDYNYSDIDYVLSIDLWTGYAFS